jgi:hypothetical protein
MINHKGHKEHEESISDLEWSLGVLCDLRGKNHPFPLRLSAFARDNS